MSVLVDFNMFIISICCEKEFAKWENNFFKNS